MIDTASDIATVDAPGMLILSNRGLMYAHAISFYKDICVSLVYIVVYIFISAWAYTVVRSAV